MYRPTALWAAGQMVKETFGRWPGHFENLPLHARTTMFLCRPGAVEIALVPCWLASTLAFGERPVVPTVVPARSACVSKDNQEQEADPCILKSQKTPGLSYC